MEGLPQLLPGRTVSHPRTGLLALLGMSAEVGLVEAQAIGGFNVARPGPGPAAADTAGAIAGPGFEVTHLGAEFFNFKP